MTDITSPMQDDNPHDNDHNGSLSMEYEDPDASSGVESPKVSIIGIGASAGGLAALQRFFDATPTDTGLSFVVVVHLSPAHESVLADLLQPRTAMPVQQVTERVEMLPNHVYVIPPNKRLLVTEGHLDLADFNMPRGQRLQIDAFFRSLAEHHGDGAAVILSGSGSDGAVGIQSIKEKGGLILVQEPSEAEYEGMPKSAIATGLVDVVAPVAELVTQLVAAKRTGATMELPTNPNELTTAAQETLTQILALLRVRVGHDFSGYKSATILRRIGRRMQLNQVQGLPTYLQRLRQSSDEVDALFRDLLIHVTEFYRDPAAWDALAESIIPKLFEGKGRDDSVRAWTVGCATGEEAYGLAILLYEYASTLPHPPRIQVFASDLGELALEFARKGVYPEAIAANITPERLDRFFVRENSHYRIRDLLREMVLFAPHNLLQDPPFSKQDLVLCRNLLIYLKRPLQERIFETFHYALRPDGYLFLGSAESTDGVTTLFEAIDKRHRFYKPIRQIQGRFVLPNMPLQPHLSRLSTATPADEDGRTLGGDEGHRHLLETLGPPSVLVDDHYHILHLSDTAGRYLQQPGGPPTTEVLKLVRPELQAELRSALFRALEVGAATLTRPIPVRFNGAPHPVSMMVRPIVAGAERQRALVFFMEDEAPLSTAPRDNNEDTDSESKRQMLAELGQAQRQLQAMREEYETTVEELRAANEELQSTNEEYRSTLEELETSKEELQSINEELQTVNQEMKHKIEETMQAHSDLQNLFAATEIATLFLDKELRIKRYTPRAGELFNLMPTDPGRPISHLRSNLHYEELEADARQVLRQLTPIQREVQSDADGGPMHWFQVHVRPYRTQNDVIDGLVITFVDVTAGKDNEAALRHAKEYAEAIVETIPDALIVLETDLRVRTANESFYEMFPVKRDETEGNYIYDLGNGQWDIPELRVLLEDILPENNIFAGYEVDHTFESIGRRTMLLNGRRLDHMQLILLSITDITQRKKSEEALAQSEARFRTLANLVPDLLWRNQPDGSTTWYNQRWLDYTGQTQAEAEGYGWLDVIHPEDRDQSLARFQAAVTGGVPLRQEHRIRSAGGEYRWFLVQAQPQRDDDNVIVAWFGAATDIQEQRDAMERIRQWNESLEANVEEGTKQVRTLVTELTMSEQAERRRISQILHDDLQQRLFGVQFQIKNVSNLLESGQLESIQSKLNEMNDALISAVQLTRNLSVNLSPPILYGEGLVEAVNWLAHQMHEQYGLTVQVNADDGAMMPEEDLRVLLFQVLRELLFNVVKHADIAEAMVTLSRRGNYVVIEVTDHGSGFDAEAVMRDATRSHGLLHSRQRLELVGGSLHFESIPNDGSRVIIECPIEAGGGRRVIGD